MITYLFAVILSQQRDVNVSCSTLVCRRRRDDLNDVRCAHTSLATRCTCCTSNWFSSMLSIGFWQHTRVHTRNVKPRSRWWLAVQLRVKMLLTVASYMILYGAAIVDRYSFLFVIFALHVVHPLINHTKYDVVQTCMSKWEGMTFELENNEQTEENIECPVWCQHYC